MGNMRNSKISIKIVALSFMLLAFYSTVAYASYKQPSIDHIKDELSAQTIQSDTQTINYGALRAKIALGEYEKGIRETTKGCNCGPQVDQYTLGLHKQWCSMFASWVFNTAGTPLSKSSQPESWRIEQARDIAKWLQENGTWYNHEEVIKNNLVPEVGDVVIFWRGNYEGNLGHADIVISVDPSKPGTATLVGGNLGDKVTLREDYQYASHYGFMGFGRINK
jgi:hypothetical protein